jgi:hypothetical protein|tara:strand:- start:3067 stop:4047 length:981 start_codon:yes stop_codon:yes gene_type:complete
MAIAPLNKFLTKAVPVTPSNQQVYEASQGTSAIILYAAVANVGIGQSYPLISFTHRRTSKATATNGNIRDIRLIKDIEVPPQDAVIIIDGRLVLERDATKIDSVFVRGYQSGVGTVYDAQYDHVTGLTTITTYDPHGFNVDDEIVLDGLAFDCPSIGGITGPIFPEPQTTFKVETVGTSTIFTTNTGTVLNLPHTFRPSLHEFVRANKDAITNVSTSAKIQVLKGTTYDSVTGILSVTAAAAHGLSNGNNIQIVEESLVFKCSQDNYTDEKKYPRASDPAGGNALLPVTVVNTTKFTVNVGVQTGGGTVSPAQMELIMSILETSKV